MSILEFGKAIIQDFGSFEYAELDLNALGLGLHFVQGINKLEPRLGSNGAGKTTIWNAICWCLYGRTLAGLRSTDVVPWDTKHKPEVTVIVYKGETEDALRAYKIKRSTISNGLWVNGKVVSQESIDQLIGLTYATFPHTIMLGQGMPLFFDLDRRVKMDILTEVLALGKWDTRSRNARDAAKLIDKQADELASKRAVSEAILNEARETLRDLKQRSSEWEAARAARDRKRETEIAEITKQRDKAKREFDDADLAYDGAETELRQLSRDAKKRAGQRADAEADLARVQAKADAATQEADEADKALEQAKTGKTCAACGQAITKAMSKDHQAKHEHAAKLKAELARNAKAQVTKARRSVDAARVLQAAADKHYDAWLKKSNDAIDTRSRAESRLNALNATLAEVERRGKQDYDEANPHHPLIEKARTVIKDAKANIEASEQMQAALETAHARVSYWIDGFKNVRLYLLAEALAELEATTNMLLPTIGLDGWFVKYDMERETKSGTTSLGLNVTIHSPRNSKAVKWEAFSGGEGQRLRLIGAIALSETLLRRASVECDLLVLDEPSRHMSPEGIGEMIDFLIERGNSQQVFYIDHGAIESSRFTSIVKVIKTAKGSTIKCQ